MLHTLEIKHGHLVSHRVEQKADWYRQLAHELASNQQLSLTADEDEYVRAIEKEGRLYDVIAIDGIHRLRCAQIAVGNLAPDGMVILDNSDWYPTTAMALRQADLIEVDFSGFGPINYYRWTTSLFLRRDVHLHPRGLQHPQGGPGSIVQVADPE